MKPTQLFNRLHKRILIGLLPAILMIPVLLLAANPSSFGEITAVNVERQVIEIDGTSYSFTDGSRIEHDSEGNIRAISANDLQSGQVVEFNADGDILRRLRVREGGYPE